VICASALLFSANVWSLDFRSVADAGAVLYDAPSTSGRKLYVVSHGYPLEVVVTLENWVKVRDATGVLSWIERKSLGDKRMVLVIAATANVYQSPANDSPVAFKAERDVILEFLEPGPPGWLKIKHREGQSGFIMESSVWGR
jgi:SH3-like domain-containing protein